MKIPRLPARFPWSRHRVASRVPMLMFCIVLMVYLMLIGAAAAEDQPALRPYEENPFYWQYEGEPVLLLGGTWQDNLFNHPTKLEEHLDLLTSVGGNYVRNTMSSRNKGSVWAFKEVEESKYDLDRWNEEYWRRLEAFLEMTRERDIIVQIEVWDPWDHFEDHQTQGGWSHHPFNPANNVTYTTEESGMPTEVDYPPTGSPSDHPFFHTVPELDDNQAVLPYQQAYVDKMLSITLEYPHVLYCMDNESGERLEWGDYWARYIRDKAGEADRTVQLTEMRRNENLLSDDHRHVRDQPDLYAFIEVSQNNARTQGQEHYDPLIRVRELLEDRPRPINNIKIYTFSGGSEESVQRFWRNIFAGCASARFHRPHPLEDPEDHLKEGESGIGLSPRAQVHVQSLRMLTDGMNIFTCEPSNGLLSDREPNEAYCLAEPGEQYAVYFPEGGAVDLDLSDARGRFNARWIEITESRWAEDREQTFDGGDTVPLETPGDGAWAVLLLPASR